MYTYFHPAILYNTAFYLVRAFVEVHQLNRINMVYPASIRFVVVGGKNELCTTKLRNVAILRKVRHSLRNITHTYSLCFVEAALNRTVLNTNPNN